MFEITYPALKSILFSDLDKEARFLTRNKLPKNFKGEVDSYSIKKDALTCYNVYYNGTIVESYVEPDAPVYPIKVEMSVKITIL